MLDTQEAHASDLADIEQHRRALQAARLRGQAGDIFTQPDTVKKGHRRPRPSDAAGRRSRRAMETRLLIRGEQAAGDGAAAGRGEPGHRGDARGASAPPSPEQLDAADRRGVRGRAGVGGHAGGRARRAAARGGRRGCARQTDELARVMTLEGGKPLVENSDEVGWTAAAFDYYAEMGRNFAGRVIPSIESTQLALVVKEPIGVVGLHRALELPAAPARLEARAGAGRRQHGGRQAVRAHAAVDADARARASTHLPPGVVQRGGRRRRRGRGARRATRASTAWPSPGRSPPARRWPRRAPSAWRA